MIQKLLVHTEGKVPDISFNISVGFVTITIKIEDVTVKYFLDSPQDIVNFKNKVLWATEKIKRK